MQGRCVRQVAMLFAVVMVAASCGGSPEESSTPLEPRSWTDTNLETGSSDLYVASSLLWRPTNIPVCWENPSAANSLQRQWVRNAVAASWEARSGVRFTGWNDCSWSSGGVRIRINDEGPHTKGLGTQLNGKAAGMVLNFTFQNWSPACRNSLQYCIEAIAVHEFGHALGYAHEQNRPDAPSWCDAEQGSNGDWLFGNWDLDSVMNYCNPDWNGNGQLSVTDAYGAQATYGVPWESLGGYLTSGPAVASWSPGRLDIFARGGDNALWHLWYDHNGWHPWESLGGYITSDPAAVSWSNGRLDIFARGGDNALWHLWYENGWRSWESLGGYLTSSPGVASWAPGRLDIFARGGDNALWHIWYENGWRPWEWLGGELTSAPDAVSWGHGRLDIFYKGPDHTLRHSWYDYTW